MHTDMASKLFTRTFTLPDVTTPSEGRVTRTEPRVVLLSCRVCLMTARQLKYQVQQHACKLRVPGVCVAEHQLLQQHPLLHHKLALSPPASHGVSHMHDPCACTQTTLTAHSTRYGHQPHARWQHVRMQCSTARGGDGCHGVGWQAAKGRR